MFYGRSVTVQRNRHSVTDGPTNQVTGVGSRDAYVSKKYKVAGGEHVTEYQHVPGLYTYVSNKTFLVKGSI